MLNINKTMFTGKLTRDPEMKYLPSGNAVCNFTVANNRSYKDKSGAWKSDATFFDCKAFGQTAERVADMRKGDGVYIEGDTRQENWEKDGQKQSKKVVNVQVAKPIKDSKSEAEPQEERASDGLNFDDSGVSDDVPF